MRLGSIVAAFVFIGLTSCKRSAPVAAPLEEPIPVMGTTYGLADIFRQIAGDQVRVGWITESSRQLGPDGTPSDETIYEFKSKQLVLTNGLNESWATSGFDDPILGRHIIRLDIRLPDPVAAVGGALWLDPNIAIAAADEATRRLSALRPSHQIQFEAANRQFASAIRAAWAKYPSLNTPALKRPIVLTIAPQFSALLLRAGIDEQRLAGAIPSALSDTDMRRIRKAIAEGVTAIVVDIDTPELLRQDLSRRTGLPVIPLDAQGSSSATSGRDSYLGILEFNLKQLAEIHKLASKT